MFFNPRVVSGHLSGPFFFSFITLLKRVSVLGSMSVSKKLPFAVSRPCRVKKFFTFFKFFFVFEIKITEGTHLKFLGKFISHEQL